VTDDEAKKAHQEARCALQMLTGGVICTPMEKEFFIRGYLLGKDSKSLVGVLNPVCQTDNSTIDLFG
jgi:hypothetical protein